jgi:hypothetical protein
MILAQPISLHNTILVGALSIFAMVISTHVSAEDAVQSNPRDVRISKTELMQWRPVAASSTSDKKSEEIENSNAVKPAAFEQDVFLVDPSESFYVESDPVSCDSCSTGYGCDSMGCRSCYPSTSRFWLRAEYLHWSLGGMDLPPLVTTSPAGTAPNDTGVLNNAGTTILFGNDSVLDSFRSGGRFTFGIDDVSNIGGLEVSGLWVSPDDVAFTDNRDLLARPVFNTTTGSEASMLVAHPDFLDGNVRIEAENQLFVIDVLRRHCLASTRLSRLDFLIGYRYAQLDEMLRIDQSSTYTAPQGPIIAGTVVELFDSFETENHFNGGEIGLQSWRASGPWKLHLTAKIGLGVNTGKVAIDGATTNTVPGGGSASFVGGLLAQETNIGTYKDSQFSAIPEVAIAMSHRLSDGFDLWLGYNFLYWQNTVRLSETIDRTVSQFPPEAPTGTRNPEFRFKTEDIVAHGLSAGATFAF